MHLLCDKYENLLQLRAFQTWGRLLHQETGGRERRDWVLPTGEGDCPEAPAVVLAGISCSSGSAAVAPGSSQLNAEEPPMLARFAFLQLKVSHDCISQRTAICNWGVGELSPAVSIWATGKADSGTKACLPQTLEWTGNCKFSLKGVGFFFCFECFLEFSSYHSPCNSEKQQPVQAHPSIPGSQGTVRRVFQKYLKCDLPENKVQLFSVEAFFF